MSLIPDNVHQLTQLIAVSIMGFLAYHGTFIWKTRNVLITVALIVAVLVILNSGLPNVSPLPLTGCLVLWVVLYSVHFFKKPSRNLSDKLKFSFILYGALVLGGSGLFVRLGMVLFLLWSDWIIMALLSMALLTWVGENRKPVMTSEILDDLEDVEHEDDED